ETDPGGSGQEAGLGSRRARGREGAEPGDAETGLAQVESALEPEAGGPPQLFLAGRLVEPVEDVAGAGRPVAEAGVRYPAVLDGARGGDEGDPAGLGLPRRHAGAARGDEEGGRDAEIPRAPGDARQVGFEPREVEVGESVEASRRKLAREEPGNRRFEQGPRLARRHARLAGGTQQGDDARDPLTEAEDVRAVRIVLLVIEREDPLRAMERRAVRRALGPAGEPGDHGFEQARGGGARQPFEGVGPDADQAVEEVEAALPILARERGREDLVDRSIAVFVRGEQAVLEVGR